jgi:plastocyanin
MKPMKAARPMLHSRPTTRPSMSRAIASLVLCVTALALVCVPLRALAASTVTVDLNLSKFATVESVDAGKTVGVKPAVVHVHVGDHVVFVNDDSDHHTATALENAVTFVDDPRWTDDALHAAGSIGSGFWTTGDLAPGQRSAPIAAQKAGTYLYGCFFDYSAGMRGEIVVEP